MLRLLQSVNKLKVSNDTFNLSYVNFQIIRWRKPRWLPVAKSKMFRVPPKRTIPEDEKLELMRLYNNYRTQMKSLRTYLYYKYCSKFLISADPEEQKRIFEEDYMRCVQINNTWNEQQKVLREKRAAEVLEAELNFARNRKEMELLKQEQKLQEIEEIVLKEKKLSENYITPENIDAAIEHAITNFTDYNFAINLSGEKIYSREKNEKIKQEASVKQ